MQIPVRKVMARQEDMRLNIVGLNTDADKGLLLM